MRELSGYGPPDQQCAVCRATFVRSVRRCPLCGAPVPALLTEDELRADLQRALGRDYDVRDRMARGATGAVFRAGQRSLQRWLAIKVLTVDGFEADRARARFVRGARLQAGFDHPHVLRVFQRLDHGWLSCVVMPLAGESLAAVLLREGRFAPREAARILLELAEALAYLHRTGVVHRDVKPQHVLLYGPERRVRLTDFSLACGTPSGPLRGPARGVLVGTPAYTSPEQGEGSRELDGRSDLYALGILGYQLLTGFVPYEGTAAQQLAAHRQQAVRNPAERLLDIPPDLAEVVMGCMAKRPQDRWGSAAELARALGQLLPARM